MTKRKVWIYAACALAAVALGSGRGATANPVTQLTGYGQVTLVNNLNEAVDLYDDDGAFVCRALAHLACTAQVIARTHNFVAKYTDGVEIGAITLTIEEGGTGVV